MPYHIKRPRPFMAEDFVYYQGNLQWSGTYGDRKIYSSDPSAMLVNNDGKNGGFNNATVVSE